MTADATLSGPDRNLLAVIARQMIPPCPKRGLPGADDEQIMEALLESLRRDRANLQAALRQVAGVANGDFCDLPPEQQATELADWRSQNPEQAAVFEMLIGRSYYQDNRVRSVIGIPPRPPYPQGYSVAQGDLSLLDPVRDRGRIYRAADGSDDTA